MQNIYKEWNVNISFVPLHPTLCQVIIDCTICLIWCCYCKEIYPGNTSGKISYWEPIQSKCLISLSRWFSLESKGICANCRIWITPKFSFNKWKDFEGPWKQKFCYWGLTDASSQCYNLYCSHPNRRVSPRNNSHYWLMKASLSTVWGLQIHSVPPGKSYRGAGVLPNTGSSAAPVMY